ncbi:MAG TPA: hypothetical protein PKA05_08415, partial [Roseiflexaceae bacterium]|nr:hypothetical protein [Roseiflexaceae bacterium]
MVAALFVATFLMVLVVVSIVLLVFSEPIDTMLKRLLHPHISAALARYRRSIHDTLGIDRGV